MKRILNLLQTSLPLLLSSSFVSHGLLPAFLLAFLLFSCKREDIRPPTVSLTAPTPFVYYPADTDIEMVGTASDDEGLASVTLSLLHYRTGSITGAKTLRLSGKSANFRIPFHLGDRYTVTDGYAIRATVTDLAGNVAQAEVHIDLAEVPLKRLGLYAAFRESSGVSIWRMDTTGQWAYAFGADARMSVLHADGRNALLVTADSLGVMRGYAHSDFGLRYTVTEPVPSGAYGFNCLLQHNREIYTGWGAPPYLLAWTDYGSSGTGYGNLPRPVTGLWDDADGFWTAGTKMDGTPFLRKHSWANGAPMAYTEPPFEPIYFHITHSNYTAWVIAGNVGNTGKVQGLQTDLTVINTHDFTSRILAGAGNVYHNFLLTEDGLYRTYSTQGVSGITQLPVPAASWTHLLLDKTDALGNVWISDGNLIQVTDHQGNALATHSLPRPNLIQWVFLYNK